MSKKPRYDVALMYRRNPSEPFQLVSASLQVKQKYLHLAVGRKQWEARDFFKNYMRCQGEVDIQIRISLPIEEDI